MNVHSRNGNRPRGRPPGKGKRQRILDAALTQFAERGFHGTAVPLVAEAASVGTGTLYRYFESKERLVNEVFRDAKRRLKGAIYDGAGIGEELDFDQDSAVLFLELWMRIVSFARREPLAFQFLEMQDHVPYLDAESRELERRVLEPIGLAGSIMQDMGEIGPLPIEAQVAMIWGALVGLLKAERLGYVTLTDDILRHAGHACWAALLHSKPAPVAPSLDFTEVSNVSTCRIPKSRTE